MAWIKQEFEAETTALDLTVKEGTHDSDETHDCDGTHDCEVSDIIQGTLEAGHVNKSLVNSHQSTFLIEEQTYCVKCQQRHVGDRCFQDTPLNHQQDQALHDAAVLVTGSLDNLHKMTELNNRKDLTESGGLSSAERSSKKISCSNDINSSRATELNKRNQTVRLSLNESLMDPFASFGDGFPFQESPDLYATPPDINHTQLDMFLMFDKGNQLCERNDSCELHSPLPTLKPKSRRTSNTLKHKSRHSIASPLKQKSRHTAASSLKCDDEDIIYNLKGKPRKIKVSDAEVKLHKCEQCGVRFLTKPLVDSHREVCTGQRPYKCDICGVGFSVNSSLVTHIRIHTGEKPYKCDLCAASFTVNSSLVSHIRTHTGEKPYKCDICGVGFTVSSGLRTHKRIHTGEKPYKCDLCDSEFTCCSSLKSHKRIHTGEKPYRCDICGVGFPVNGSLKSHKRIHTGEKPYICDICGVGFTVSTSLSSHRRIHTGEKPYNCDLCGITFTRYGHLQRHQKMHTAEVHSC